MAVQGTPSLVLVHTTDADKHLLQVLHQVSSLSAEVTVRSDTFLALPAPSTTRHDCMDS